METGSHPADANVYGLKFYFNAIIFRLGGMNCQR